jgi:hypothetical protein
MSDATGPTDGPGPTEAAEPSEPEGPGGPGAPAGTAPGQVTDHEPVGEGHRGSGGVDDRAVPWRVFVAVGGLVTVMGAIYWATSDDEAGIVLLVISAVLAFWSALYLWLQLRRLRRPTAEAVAAESEEPEYLPHASVWPFAIGLGAATLANGLVLGIWVLVPGAALTALGVGGFVRQSRHRD